MEDTFQAAVSEYTVSPTDRQEITFGINRGKIYRTNSTDGEVNEAKSQAAKDIIANRLDAIVAINAKQVDVSKGGRQKAIHITYNDNQYKVIGNTDDQESIALYEELRDELDKIINN